MADNMIISIATDIAMHKFYIASAKPCRIRLVEPEKSGQAATLLWARLAGAGAPGSLMRLEISAASGIPGE